MNNIIKNEFNCVALLPIKKNSVRIKNKNFKIIQGKPLYQWMLNKLIKNKKIEKIIINTDAFDYFKKTKYFNNDKIIFRKRKKILCGDHISMNKIIKDDISFIHSKIYFMTHVTSPNIKINTINDVIKLYNENFKKKYDSIFSVNEHFNRFYFFDLKPINHNPKVLIRTQDLKPIYEENSCFYVFNKTSFNQSFSRIGRKPFPYVISKIESIDIDNKEDWKIANKILND